MECIQRRENALFTNGPSSDIMKCKEKVNCKLYLSIYSFSVAIKEINHEVLSVSRDSKFFGQFIRSTRVTIGKTLVDVQVSIDQKILIHLNLRETRIEIIFLVTLILRITAFGASPRRKAIDITGRLRAPKRSSTLIPTLVSVGTAKLKKTCL